MTRILVTTDGSDLGHLALTHARALAAALHAELTVLCVQLDPGVALAGEFGYLPPAEPAEVAEQKRAMETALQARVPGARVRVELAGGRAIAQAISDIARDEGAALIVMSTHGRSGLGRMLLGSVAQAVACCAPVPVMLVRAGHTPPQWLTPPFMAELQTGGNLQG
ncbi:universal stress protein [Deinococcus koreensis]|uniref:Universal stress protein n=1 Tax=Deinococcus koreensis TaxID=2054903 RepID=A0A2K3V0W9_9DEIO|nr:universal stress protein [Deinococcus koreensis]PNY82427.1 universal stress protein [Deinococcus koreensis]